MDDCFYEDKPQLQQKSTQYKGQSQNSMHTLCESSLKCPCYSSYNDTRPSSLHSTLALLYFGEKFEFPLKSQKVHIYRKRK